MKYSKLGRDYEKLVEKDYDNGKRQPGSGCHWSAKSDIKTDLFLIEVKFTTNDAYTLMYEDLIKCFEQAYKIGKIPIFQVGFYGGQEFVILDSDTVDITEDTADIYVKPGLKSKKLSKSLLLEKPEIKTMVYNKLSLYIMPKKKFKELMNE